MLYIIGLLAGFILANQSPINAKLGAIFKSPFRSSLISFLVGTVFLSLTYFISGQHANNLLTIAGQNPWWIWTGGIFGFFYLTSNILMFPKLGAIQTIILPILGQVLMGEAIDTFGLFGAERMPLGMMKIFGILALFVGIFVAVVLVNLRESKREEQIDEKGETSVELNLWRVWGVVAGALSAIQQAVNGHLGQALGSPVASSVVSFVVGTVVIFVVVLVRDKSFKPTGLSLKGQPWWIFLGGIMGALFVLASAYLVPKLGAGITVTLGLFGSIIGSMFVSQFGLWRSFKNRVTLIQIIGIVIMAAGVVLIKFG
ncbi:MAG: DMT family transporter [Lactobacillaceae bacterium]|jgi:transporter family-2 protein|nr:DMT family transporter [Lactobacillaceae bacterium]